MAAASARSDAAFGRGLLQLLIVGGPIAVGLYALRAPVNKSFGIALLGIGFAWSLTALAESALSVPHTIGRLATWLIFPCVVYLLLAFPQGRIEGGLDRAVFAGVVGVMLVLFFGTAPFVQAFPPKTLWSTCTTDCPANALFILDEQPAFMTKVVLVREWLVELLWLGLLYSMFRRWRAASLLQRRAMGPAFVAGTLLRPVSLRAHHVATAGRADGHGDRALLGLDVLHRRRVRGLPVRTVVETDAVGRGAGTVGRRPPRQR